MLVYTRALSWAKYVRIQDCGRHGTELGLFVTRLRTGMGEEIALPNSVVLANVTRNFSRVAPGTGFVLDTTITIGYDERLGGRCTPCCSKLRKPSPRSARNLEPYVVQTALSDFYVAYKLVVYVSADRPAARARVTSDLYAAIQDTFNKFWRADHVAQLLRRPRKPKIVPESEWFAAPAKGHR